jgi:lipid-binding SYLF domain-containing protein
MRERPAPAERAAETRRRAWITGIGLLAILTASLVMTIPVLAASQQELGRDSLQALESLYARNSAARMLGKKATAVLVFPHMLKAGFMFGGQIGEGALLKDGKPTAYYSSVAASYGLQAGAQEFGYALFFMNQAALAYLDKSGGFELGAGPSFVVVDEGVGKSLTSTTLTQDVYAFIFNQKGLMGGLGLQGSKITKISR